MRETSLRKRLYQWRDHHPPGLMAVRKNHPGIHPDEGLADPIKFLK
jgi:hypothetical protein